MQRFIIIETPHNRHESMSFFAKDSSLNIVYSSHNQDGGIYEHMGLHSKTELSGETSPSAPLWWPRLAPSPRTVSCSALAALSNSVYL